MEEEFSLFLRLLYWPKKFFLHMQIHNPIMAPFLCLMEKPRENPLALDDYYKHGNSIGFCRDFQRVVCVCVFQGLLQNFFQISLPTAAAAKVSSKVCLKLS